MTGGMGQFGGGMKTGINLGARATATAGRFGSVARLAGRGVPIIGTVAAGAMAYGGGRDKGYSKGKSAGRAGFGIGGAIIGGALGSIVPGAGTAVGAMVGGAAGSFLGPMIFDALFGKKGGGGGGSSNLNVGGGAGMAGYRVPTFVAQSAEANAAGVEEKGFVLDEGLIDLKVKEHLEQMGLSAATASTEVDKLGNAALAASVLVVGSLEDLSSRFYQFSMYNKDDPTDTGSGGASNKDGLFKDANLPTPEQLAANKRLEDMKAADALANAEDELESKNFNNTFLAEKAEERKAILAEKADQTRANDLLEISKGDLGKEYIPTMFNAVEDMPEQLKAADALANMEKAVEEGVSIIGNEVAMVSGSDMHETPTHIPSIDEALAMSGGAEQSDFTGGDVGTGGANNVVNISIIQQQGIEQAQATKIGSAWAHVMYGTGGEFGNWG